MQHFEHSSLSPQCAAQSCGAANWLFVSLVQSLLAAQCSISPPEMWPRDHGQTELKDGMFESKLNNLFYN